MAFGLLSLTSKTDGCSRCETVLVDAANTQYFQNFLFCMSAVSGLYDRAKKSNNSDASLIDQFQDKTMGYFVAWIIINADSSAHELI